ncbi:MAG: hypothetical protein JXR75_13685 [Rhodobacteraceae bacterium]|nr:hypothetical protein [Paracoccaceae bacterium]
MKFSSATVTITGLSPLSQSRQHDDAKLQGESHEDYDKRTWRSKLNIDRSTGLVIIPAHGMHQAMIAAAKYSGEQIPGQGKKTWTAKFTTGLSFVGNVETGLRPDAAIETVVSCNADGVRGSGKRVMRRFPIYYQWSATFEVMILDPIITEAQFHKTLEMAGMFIGIGRFRPEKGGTNGRFKVSKIVWQDNRQMVA